VRAIATSKNDRCAHRFLGYWRSQDVFGEKVHFTYKGKMSYQTSIGALISVIIKFIMILFIVYEAYTIFTRKHPAISVKTSHHDLSLEPSTVLPFKYGFDIAVGLTTRNKNLLGVGSSNLISKSLDNEEIEEHVHLNYLDPSFGKLTASYDVIDWDHISGRKSLNSTPI
jgi:hypothetical protein